MLTSMNCNEIIDRNMYSPRPISPPNTKIEITNSKIINFYNTHPHINIDEINLYFINILLSNEIKVSNNHSTLTLPNIVSDIQFKNTQIQTQSQFISTLSKMYPNADIIKKNTEDNDIITMKRIKKSKILIKNIDIESNVSGEQISSFFNLIDQEKCSGIIMSQKSGISNKNHFQIDIHNSNIVIYIHNVNYSQSVITSSIDIIDNLYSKMQDFSKQFGQDYTIPKEVLDNINNEYQLFIVQKELIINTVKEYQKKIISQVDECQFSSLSNYLSEKYSAPVKKLGFNCELCSKYSGHNLKALAAHKRGCIRKNRTLTI